ncbi:DUF4097 family beta strand repeat-containing protein [Allokutzneria sp. NRRL B-24872]|uniref:DUF4097 family beta strand repeat-containing protein n=1 Tax=Allokutzneria sp. NRRL B-24872 TaxID=1137961 RepID=UPI000A3C8C15|nr:DUF4097 family beta strand repeat-containing protein [Allokutzneria sp. NRRL B-24872]
MPIFETPQAISATVKIAVGDIRIVASERTDTVVEVVPTNPDDASDVKAAEQTRVDYADGNLVITGPKSVTLGLSKKTRSIDVTVQLPTGSRLDGDVALGEITAQGALGTCEVKTAAGHVRLDRTGALRLETSAGHASVERAVGRAEITTGTGKIQIGELDGTGTVKTANGHVEIGTVTGEVRVRSANGDIAVEHALGDRIEAATSNGSVRVGDVVRGVVVIKTGAGDLEIGVREGTAALLDVSTGFGRVRNALAEVASPGGASETVEVQAKTNYGDVIVRRS